MDFRLSNQSQINEPSERKILWNDFVKKPIIDCKTKENATKYECKKRDIFEGIQNKYIKMNIKNVLIKDKNTYFFLDENLQFFSI